MMPLRAERRSRWLRSFGVLVLAVLSLGSAGHFWHHVVDDCETPARSVSHHPCAQCAGFHGGLLSEATLTAAAPRLADLAAVIPGELPDRAEQPSGVGSPRAPPTT